MRKKGLLVAAMLSLAASGLIASVPLPQVAVPGTPALTPEQASGSVTDLAGPQPASPQAPQAQAGPATVMTPARLGKAMTGFTPVANATPRRAALPAKAPAIDALAGQYVMTYKSLVSTQGDGGNGGSIERIAGKDSVILHNFWTGDIDVRAHYDAATGTLTIPAQKLYVHPTYGDMWLALCGPDGKPNYNTAMTGHATDNGVVIDSWFGVFVKSGTQAGSFMMAGYDGTYARSNATMTTDVFNGSPLTYNVIVSQPFDNQVSVVNFGNFGCTVNIDLNRYSSGVIHSQVVRAYPQNADFLTCSVGGYTLNDAGNVVLQSPLANDIMLDTLTGVKQTNTLTFGKWSALSNGASARYFLAPFLNGKIQTQTPVRFPVLDVTEFAGAGTEADPYQIKTRDDLVLLSQKTQDCTDYNPNTPPNYAKQAQAFKGKFFKVMNDIDMAGTNFTAIGRGFQNRFAGTFDGGNHVIRNLSITTQESFGGLFGMCDTTAVLKNVRMENADVEMTANYGGILAAWTYGSIDNCHVSGSTLIVQGQVAGGIAGVVFGMSNCTSVDNQVVCTGGWQGGLAGEVHTYFRDCSATGATIVGYPGGGTTCGGAAGLITSATAERIYFSGLVDGYRLGAPSQGSTTGILAGGICGNLSASTLTDAFATGTVMGRNTYCEVGGVSGRVTGSGIENAYFRGRVASYYSRMTGGLTGRVFGLTNAGGTVTSSFRNMYVAAPVTSETYQYNRNTGWAETLGQVEEGALGKAENIYYDKQVFSVNSANGTPMTTAQLTSGTLPAGFPAAKFTASAGSYPVFTAWKNTPAAQWGASAILLTEGASLASINRNAKLSAIGSTIFKLYKDGKGYDTGYASKIVGDSLVITDFGVDTLLFINGKQNFYYQIKCAPVPFAGAGTELDPYRISTKADLIALANFANNSQQYFPGSYFLQTNDIDLELDTAFHGIATQPSDAHCRFAGIYDGGNHYIHRMQGRGLIWKTPPTETTMGTPNTGSNGGSFGYQGFIGRLDVDGVLKNIRFASDCNFEMWASCAAGVGSNYGLIQNVRNYADIKAVSCWAGGIAGMNEMEGRIIDCYNEGLVTSCYNSIGGITGRNNGIIENCANIGAVECYKWANFGSNPNVVGGIAPSMSGGIMRNVLNMGPVYASGGAVGGLVGNLYRLGTSKGPGKNNILGGLTIGNVRTPVTATGGAVAGMNTNQTAVEADAPFSTYYELPTAQFGAYANDDRAGMTGLSTERLTDGQPIDSLSTEYWQYDAGKYPILKTFADEPRLQAARTVIMTLPANVTVRDLTADATLSGNATWSVEPSTYYKVQDGKLKTGAVPTKVEEATVTGSLSGFERPIDIKRIPPVPLTGDGTQASPYLITSVNDWNNLAAYIDGTHDRFTGKFLRLTADLTFTSAPAMLFGGDADLLEGTLDGDGHTVDFGNGLFVPDNTYRAPIRTVGADGKICNFTFRGTIKAGKANCGAVTARLYGTVSNVASHINFTGTSGVSVFGTSYAGARLEKAVNHGTITGASTYLGALLADAGDGTILTDCGNVGTVHNTFSGSAPSTGQSIGGLIGSAKYVKMTRCYNTGRLTFAKPEVMYGVGGLIGWCRTTSGSKDSTVLQDCYNTAAVEAGFMIGGLISNLDYSSTALNPIIIRNCYNTGDIISRATASKTNGAIGGIAVMSAPGMQILGCRNSGAIINTNAKQAYAAGILAYYKTGGTVAAPVLVADCHNTGDVNNAYNFSGGIIGYAAAYTTITRCSNTGAIDAVLGSGGIAGTLGAATAVISESRNLGAITCQDCRAGGIVGQANSTNAQVNDCFNVGTVTNQAAAVVVNATTKQATKGYGTGGIAGEGGAKMTRCYNVGTVTGKANVGGLVGRPTKNNTILTDCYNAGEIIAPADTAGSLIGFDPRTAGRLWNPETNKVENCWFVSVDSLANNILGTGKTRAELASMSMGEGWISGDQYTYPYLAANDNDLARLYAVQVMPNPTHVTSNGVITGSFFTGAADGVNWTASIGNVALSGPNKWLWSSDAFSGKFFLTATAGELVRRVELEADKPTGVDGIDADADVISETWYTVSGLQVARPAERDGQVYVVVRRYADGTTRSLRIRN